MPPGNTTIMHPHRQDVKAPLRASNEPPGRVDAKYMPFGMIHSLSRRLPSPERCTGYTRRKRPQTRTFSKFLNVAGETMRAGEGVHTWGVIYRKTYISIMIYASLNMHHNAYAQQHICIMTYIHTHAYDITQSHTHMHIHTYTTHTYMHIHTCIMHTHTYTYAHTRITYM